MSWTVRAAALLLTASMIVLLGGCSQQAQQPSVDGAAAGQSGEAAASEGESFLADGSYRAGEPLQAMEPVPLALSH